jgi:ubiquinone/menaquinone biosynthesis C-methylase UbiE
MQSAKTETEKNIEAWNTVLFEKFCRFEHLLTRGLSAHSEEALARYPHPEGAHVLDVGCGFGDTARQIARDVGPRGRVVGVDCAANFVRRASEDASKEGLDNLSFIEADVQTGDLGGPYDYAFSRFGMMFFSFPGAALRNIRRALVPGGRLTMVVWRRREANPWLYDAETRVKGIVPVVSHDETDDVHCGPGPFSMAGPDMVSDMLRAAGYERATFQRFDADIRIGQDLEEAVEFAMALGPAGEIMRLAGEEGERRRDEVVAALRDTFAQYQRDDGIWAPSSTWLITASNPSDG